VLQQFVDIFGGIREHRLDEPRSRICNNSEIELVARRSMSAFIDPKWLNLI
jgi:hypothetical protein